MPTPKSPAPAARGTSLRLLPAELVANLESAPYQYASTMAGIPHYYTLRKKWDDDEAFVWTVAEMRKHEVERPFYKRQQQYLDVNGFQYWTMDAKARETTLINRQYCWHGAYWSRYDAGAQGYDSPWGGEWALQEKREAHYTLATPRGRVLDIGCGTGLFVDYRYREVDRESYVGIDPSFGMLAKFRLKHPDYDAHATLLRTTFEDYETTLRFDTIVAMFGAASYVTGTDVVAKTRRLLAPGGRAVLTFYRDPARFYEDSGLGEVPELTPVPAATSKTGDFHVLELSSADD